MQVVIVAGEASGDILGAGLIKALQEFWPKATFSGIGGPKMQALGFESLFPMDRLSVMGFVEPLKRLPELLSIRKAIKQHCLAIEADVFIGIDSPDFNLNIEKFTKHHGIKTVHYVSPSVWAWRQGRVKGIKKSVDLMLALLPFEAEFYKQHDVPVAFIGHPLADDIALITDTQKARLELGVTGKTVVALMPGSRGSEVGLLGELFFTVAENIHHQIAGCEFLIPAANNERKQQILAMFAAHNYSFNYQLFDGQSHTVMAASDVVLLASGTTALEAMLLKKPMVVAYKMSAFSYWLLSKLVKTEFISLPNLLAGKALVPELIQHQANVPNVQQELQALLENNQATEQLQQIFTEQHQQLAKNASNSAAKAIVRLCDDRV